MVVWQQADLRSMPRHADTEKAASCSSWVSHATKEPIVGVNRAQANQTLDCPWTELHLPA